VFLGYPPNPQPQNPKSPIPNPQSPKLFLKICSIYNIKLILNNNE